MEELDERRAEVQTLIVKLEASQTTQANLIPQTEELLASYDDMTNEERNELLKEILEKIEYTAAHEKDFDGLILLAAYSTKDLTGTPLRVLSVYGSEDGVLNRESYEKNRSNLPTDTTEVVLDGGCHAQFGSYGPQDGDGIPTISGEEQVRQTVEAIVAFVGR